MERERLTRLLRDPGQVIREDLADLRSLTERYPWFSGAQVLRAGGERSAGEVGADEALSLAAVHVPSRAVLYDLGHSTRQQDLHQQGSEQKPSVDRVMNPGPVDATPQPAVAQPTSVQGPIIPDPDLTDGPAFTKTDPVIGDGPQQAGIDEDPLERQILEAALASAYDLALSAPPTPVASGPEQLHAATTIAKVPEDAPTPSVPIAGPIAAGAEEPPSLPATGPSPTPLDQVPGGAVRRRFSSWLESAPQPTPTVGGGAPLGAMSAQESQEPLATTGTGMPKGPLSPSETMSIVDRFISQESPVPAPKATFFTPQQAAKKSLDDTAGLVTETLARIYAKQGNITKAIDAYRKLALKYPDKSAYFAALAKSLEEQQNK
jgi:hypothetical protein